MKRIIAILAAGLVLAAATARADRDSPLPDRRDAYLTFYLDNDLFAGTDQNYTNGARLSWISGSRPVSELGSVQRLLRRFSGDAESFRIMQWLTGFEDPGRVDYNYGFSLTQLMFTPEDDSFRGQPPGERPYAGWLGLGFSLHAMDDRVLNSAELAFGVIGPHALAEETQDFVHDVKGVPKFDGWDAQLPNELTINYYFQQKRRLDLGVRAFETGMLRADATWDWAVALGNFRTHAETGLFLRAGWNLPTDFSDPRLSETAYSHRYFRGGATSGDWSVYVLAGARGRAALFDATLDGPLFRDFETGIDGEWATGEVFAGLGVRWRCWEFSYAQTFRTREFAGQGGGQQFGSLALRRAF